MIALTLALAVAVQDPELTPATFEKLSAMFRPQPGECRFWDVPWQLSLGEARRKAAREGKPLFIWSMDGNPLGCG